MVPSHAESSATLDQALAALAALTIKIKDKLKVAKHDCALEKFAIEAVTRITALRKDQSALSLISAPSQCRLDYLTALAWAAEVMEYFGHLGEGSDTYALVKSEGPAIHSGLFGRSSPTEDLEMRIAREEVWVALSWARGLYRLHKYDEALRVLERCEDFVENKLQREGFACHFTLASLWTLHAKVLRQQVNLQGAKIYYDRALSRIYQRLQVWSNVRVSCEAARILAFGHGWILYEQGLLEEARAAVSTALVILHGTDDVIYKAYGEMLLCMVSRARIGTNPASGALPLGMNPPTLHRVIASLLESYEIFKKFGHEPYAARAAYELARSFLARGLADPSGARKDFEEAEESLKEVLGLDDTRWQSNAWIVLSRVQRAKADLEADIAGWNNAESSALNALRIGDEAKLDFCRTEAHIALGEVYSRHPEADNLSWKKALYHFNKALELAKKNSNPKPSAVCHLHLAKVHLKQGDLREAQSALDEWAKVENKIQDATVRAFGLEVTAAVKEAKQEYYIVDTESSLNIEQQTDQLLHFLLTQARARYKDPEKRFQALGVSRATYYNLWRRLGEKPSVHDLKEGQTT